jgi:hypothetical protein
MRRHERMKREAFLPRNETNFGAGSFGEKHAHISNHEHHSSTGRHLGSGKK